MAEASLCTLAHLDYFEELAVRWEQGVWNLAGICGEHESLFDGKPSVPRALHKRSAERDLVNNVALPCCGVGPVQEPDIDREIIIPPLGVRICSPKRSQVQAVKSNIDDRRVLRWSEEGKCAGVDTGKFQSLTPVLQGRTVFPADGQATRFVVRIEFTTDD